MMPDLSSAQSRLGEAQLSKTVLRCSSSCQAHLAGSCQSLTLADVIYTAPTLLECLPAKSKSAVSGCSRQLRQLLHAITKIVKIQTCEELRHLGNSEWPQLEMVLANDWGLYMDGRETAGKPLAAVIELCLKQRRDRQLEQHHTTIVAAMTTQSDSALTAAKLSPTVLDYLKQPRWSQLQCLKLTDSKLSPEGIAQLAAVDWPHLYDLDVSCNQLDATGIAQLVKGTWPKLGSLNVGHNSLDAEAIRLLVTQDWQLKILELENNPLSQGASMCELVQHKWAKLNSLNLYDTGIFSRAFADFAQGSWQYVQGLYLGSDSLGRDAMAKLALASLPCLRMLAIVDSNLNAAALQQVVRSDWPLLEDLNLRNNCLDDAAMFHLANGQWPALFSLSVEDNNITSVGVNFLTHGAWPELLDLTFGTAAVCAETWALLSLAGTCELQFAQKSCARCKRVKNKLPLGRHKVWPRLSSVWFTTWKDVR